MSGHIDIDINFTFFLLHHIDTLLIFTDNAHPEPRPVSTRQLPEVVGAKPEAVMDRPPPETDSEPADSLSYPAGGGRLAKMIELPRAAFTPWEAASQFGGSVEPALEHIDAYRAAAANITLDDFFDDDEEDPAPQRTMDHPPQFQVTVHICSATLQARRAT